MLKSMLVGLDGSSDSDSALELSVRWAKRFDALLVGMGVIDEPGIHGAEEVWLGEVYFRQINERLSVDLQRKVDRALERAALRCAEVGVSFKPLEDVGAPHEKLLIAAQRFDLIVMGQHTHFRFGWQDEADDTLRRVLAENPRPVVAVPTSPSAGESVLIAFDGSVQSARALQAFQQSGLAEGQENLIVTIAEDRVEAARCADRASEFLSQHGIRSRPIAIASTQSPADLILEQAKQINAGLLVMGAYGQSTFREILIGSVTRTALKHSGIPIFLYH